MLQKLDPKTTALVLIDLQQGILGFGKAPRSAEAVLASSAKLAKRFRQLNAPVVLVRVGWSADFGDALKQPVDQPVTLPAGGLPSTWWDYPEALEVAEHDLKITKRQWNAFHGTELDLQLRRRGVQTIVLGGISTNIGVESTARQAWEHGYALILAEDATSGMSAEMHSFAFQNIFPRISRIARAADIDFAR